MSDFIQIHLLTAYPPSNLNRDDLGRPKTAFMGGCERLRISSQCIKRAIRTSAEFAYGLEDKLGFATRCIPEYINRKLTAAGVDEENIFTFIKSVHDANVKKSDKNGKDESSKKSAVKFNKKNGRASIDELLKALREDAKETARYSKAEFDYVDHICQQVIENPNCQLTEQELKILKHQDISVDIALFGRMYAREPDYNVEAACQISHPISVSPAIIEADFFTAVDDLAENCNQPKVSMIDTTLFGSAIFYTYACIDMELLKRNLEGDVELAALAAKNFIEAITKVSPSGHQNSFASRAFAEYALVERGSQTPRSLVSAFYKPVYGRDQLSEAVKRLRAFKLEIDRAYNWHAEKEAELCVAENKGSLEDLTNIIGK